MTCPSSFEQWKAIPGYEGLYEASTTGFIRTAEGKTTFSVRRGQRRWRSRVLKGRGDRYATGSRVLLYKDGRRHDWLVARLVAMTWVPGYSPELTVNHIDGNRLNNRVENLEWVTLADNIRHAFESGLHSCQTSTTLIGDEEILTFRSMSVAGQSIGRNSGYINNCIKHGRPAVSIDGRRYKIAV